jgi:hypothetical protein
MCPKILLKKNGFALFIAFSLAGRLNFRLPKRKEVFDHT